MSFTDYIKEVLNQPNKWDPYNGSSSDFVSTWFREDPYFQAIVRYIIKTRLPQRIEKMKKYVGSDLAKWTGWEWKDAEYVHLFIGEIIRQIEVVVVEDESDESDQSESDESAEPDKQEKETRKAMRGTVFMNSQEYDFANEAEFMKICSHVLAKIESFVDQILVIGGYVHDSAGKKKARKDAYISTIKAIVGVDLDDKIDNPNLGYVRSLVGLIDEPTF